MGKGELLEKFSPSPAQLPFPLQNFFIKLDAVINFIHDVTNTYLP